MRQSATPPTIAILLGWVFAATAHAAADLVLVNGEIRTPSGWAQAMAVEGGVIAAVGSNEAVGALASETSTLIDLRGDAVFPGFHDMHVHPFFAGTEQMGCGFAAGATPEVIARRVAECVKSAEPGEWIRGGNWVAAVFEEGQQTRTFLDALAPDNPVVLVDESHHSIWVNSLALMLAGVDKDTPDPEGGIIERDVDGEPNGLLRESAEALVVQAMPPLSEEEKRVALTLSTSQMLEYGITSFTSASGRESNLPVLAALSREGVVKQRARICTVWEHQPESLRLMAEKLINGRARYSSDRFSADCIKLFLDGVPTESKTAAMLAPYAGSAAHSHGEGTQDSGMLLIPEDTLKAAVAHFDRQGLHIKFHAVGDAAVRAAIDAVEYARRENGFGGPMHDVGHCSFVDPEDLPRVRELGMAWEFSPYIWYPTPIASQDIMNAVGEERMRRWIPIRDALETGGLVVAGSDWSVVPSVNPWLAIETMVTRQIPGGSEQTLGIEQAVSLEEAFDILTINGARLMGHSDEVGSIEVGKRADIFITHGNPLKGDIRDLHRAQVRSTYIDGVLVYQAGE